MFRSSFLLTLVFFCSIDAANGMEDAGARASIERLEATISAQGELLKQHARLIELLLSERPSQPPPDLAGDAPTEKAVGQQEFQHRRPTSSGGTSTRDLLSSERIDATRITHGSIETCQSKVLCDQHVTGDLHVNGSIYYRGIFLGVPYSPTLLPTPAPTPLPTAAPTEVRAFSCATLAALGRTESGVYTVFPQGVDNAGVDVYCDLATDGGGWMLTYSYNRNAGENNGLDHASTPPTSPDSGYSHVNVNDLAGYLEGDIAEVRFYCTSSQHSRVVHFKTATPFQAGAAWDADLGGNTPSYWTTGYTPLVGHTGYLPGTTTTTHTSSSGGFFDAAFYSQEPGAENSHQIWCIYYAGALYECDDYAGQVGTGYQFSTRHHVYVRMAK